MSDVEVQSTEQQTPTPPKTPPTMKSIVGCTAGAVAVTAVMFFTPWSALFSGIASALATVMATLLFLLSFLANKTTMAVGVALLLTSICIAVKHSNTPQAEKAGILICILIPTILLVGFASIFDEPNRGSLHLTIKYPELYETVVQMTPQERKNLDKIYIHSNTWADDQRQTAALLGESVAQMGSFEFREFRRSLSYLERDASELVTYKGCQRVVKMYRQPSMTNLNLIVNGKTVENTDTSDMLCKWSSFNNITSSVHLPE